MRIGELAVASGTTTKTLRFYEEAGLLPAPERTANGYRDYTPAALARLDFVRSPWPRFARSSTSATPESHPASTCTPCSKPTWATWTAKSPTCKHCDTPSRTFTTVPPPATPPNATPRPSAAICDQTGARVYRHEQMPPQSVDRTPPYNGESHTPATDPALKMVGIASHSSSTAEIRHSGGTAVLADLAQFLQARVSAAGSRTGHLSDAVPVCRCCGTGRGLVVTRSSARGKDR